MSLASEIMSSILPEYGRRHVFTAKLRLVAFIGFWAMYLFFLRDVLNQTKVVAVIVFASFTITAFAYYNVMRARHLMASFVMEILSDLTAITAVLYLTGGPYSPYYTVYLFYVIVAGVIYNYRLAAVIAFVSAVFYGTFLFLCNEGIIGPLILEYGDKLPVATYTPFAHFMMAAIFLAGIVYTVKVAGVFSQQREMTLEKRNRELTAFHRLTSTIRSTRSLKEVIDHLLKSVLEGLGFKAALLLHFDRVKKVARFYAPDGMAGLREIEDVFGTKIDGLDLPLGLFRGKVSREIEKRRLVFRRNLAELADGMGERFIGEKLRAIQERLKFGRVVVTPLVLEDELLGALIGISSEPLAEEEQVATMESFANQSAISLETAGLIERLKQLNRELVEANRVKSEFLATMSHELRTPLTAIIGFTELILEGVMGPLVEEQKDGLREVLHNSADLLDMINSLLDLTKIESGKMILDAREFSLEDTIRRVCSTITPLVQKKSQRLDVDIANAAIQMTGDERKIQQTILNLIANANKFTPDGGCIKVRAKTFDKSVFDGLNVGWAGRLSAVESSFKNGGIEISVSDTGVGIDEEHIEQIFDMFHQADGSITRSFGGTGLGLALARRFVEMHNGRIWAESELGKGARFTVVLPMNVK